MSPGRTLASAPPVVRSSLPAAKVLVFVVAALLTVGCSAHQSGPLISHGPVLPGESVTADLDGDEALEVILVDPDDGCLSITDGAVSYRSRDRWRVVQALLGDTDHNGLTEVITLLDSDRGRHLGLFAYYGGEYRERLVTQRINPAPTAIEILAWDDAKRSPQLRAGAPPPGDLVVLLQDAGGGAARRTLLRWNGLGYTRVETPAGF